MQICSYKKIISFLEKIRILYDSKNKMEWTEP